MYFKNFKEPERIFSSIDNKGIAVLKNFLTKQKILEIKKKSIKSLDKVNLLVTPSNVKEISKITWIQTQCSCQYSGMFM